MAGAANGIVGDNFGTEIPDTDVPEQDLSEEKAMAQFTNTPEFQRIKQYAEARIEFYQKFLPDGTNVIGANISQSELGNKWQVASAVIGEFKGLLTAYQTATDVVKEASQEK